ncbi:uncharacterized protein CELE_C06G3.3 [Caenorhabditis elegans]|uniref:Uncharacterized protein n=1 Tax=Caenorhabditis elegans TaxID=6239 RepID=Q17751_CAEEL|nr:Uncharacterized protein CELE_C06G3.3 [Caenorhabditis elegans]CCD83550.1 Uncharacterized protein CELE_C06G3.3 [Caenorhabditis elegans]|eukprot:NP_501091.1 Uncharacterized protein CELE_C06G3.3 [Caenorhabditis elegans]
MPNPSPAILMPKSILKKPDQSQHESPSNSPVSPSPQEVPRGKKEWWLPFNIPFHNEIFRKNSGF